MSHNEIKFNDNEPTASSSFSVYSLEQVVIGRSESNNLSNSGFVGFGTGNNIYFYDTNPINTITGASLTGSSDWYYQVSLPAGYYMIEAKAGFKFTGSGAVNFRNYVGSSATGSVGSCGTDRHQKFNGGNLSKWAGQLTSTSNITIKIESVGSADSIANQGTLPSEVSYLRIIKING